MGSGINDTSIRTSFGHLDPTRTGRRSDIGNKQDRPRFGSEITRYSRISSEHNEDRSDDLIGLNMGGDNRPTGYQVE